jgi:hypothetical protein
VLERLQVEVGVELAVDDVQNVLVELGRDTGRVVVRGLETRPVLDQIGPQEEAIPWVHQGGDPGQEGAPSCRIEVADRAPEEREQAALLARKPLEMDLVVTDNSVDGEVWVLADQLRGRPPRDLLGDVHGDVRLQQLRLVHRVEQHARLRSRAGTKLDQGVAPGRLHDLGGVVLEDRALRPGRVVLGQLGDLLEQA